MAHRHRYLSALPLVLFAPHGAGQDQSADANGVAVVADDQEGTVTVYGVGTVAETSTGALVTRTSEPSFFTLLRPTVCQEDAPAEPRNPFLLLEEQNTGKTRTELLELAAAVAAGREQALAAERESKAALEANLSESTDPERERRAQLAELRTRLESRRVSALLLGASGCAALLDGNVVRIGDKVLDDSAHVESITLEGVRVACGSEIVLIALEPVGVAVGASATPMPGEEPAPSESTAKEEGEHP